MHGQRRDTSFGRHLPILDAQACEVLLALACRPALQKLAAVTREVDLLLVQEGTRSLTVFREESQ